MSKSQLETVVSRLVGGFGEISGRAVSCESGIEGRVGALAHCQVDGPDVRVRRTVAVSAVNGLKMEIDVVAHR